MRLRIKILSSLAALALAGAASATTTWTLSPGSVTAGSGTSQATAALTGWANTGGSGNTLLQTQTLSPYGGGLGMTNSDVSTTPGDPNENTAPEHAVDNNDRVEMIALNFGAKKVNLSSLSIGYVGNQEFGYSTTYNGNYTVMAYTGSGTPTLLNNSWNLLGSSWQTVSTSNTTTGSKSTGISNSTYSSYWLIGAYNYLLGSATASAPTISSAIKLASVTGCVQGDVTSTGCTIVRPSSVPEPGSMALIGLALLGMISMRRRRQA